MDEPAKKGAVAPFIGPEPACGIAKELSLKLDKIRNQRLLERTLKRKLYEYLIKLIKA